MKGSAISLAVFCLMAFSGVSMHAADAAKIAGKWAVTSQEPGGTQTRVLNIAQNGDKIVGTLKSKVVVYPVEGSVDGNKVTFTVKMHTPRGEMTAVYSGTTEGDSMKGTAKMEKADMDWTATQMHEP